MHNSWQILVDNGNKLTSFSSMAHRIRVQYYSAWDNSWTVLFGQNYNQKTNKLFAIHPKV